MASAACRRQSTTAGSGIPPARPITKASRAMVRNTADFRRGLAL
jgi:hypothetical protein